MGDSINSESPKANDADDAGSSFAAEKSFKEKYPAMCNNLVCDGGEIVGEVVAGPSVHVEPQAEKTLKHRIFTLENIVMKMQAQNQTFKKELCSMSSTIQTLTESIYNLKRADESSITGTPKLESVEVAETNSSTVNGHVDSINKDSSWLNGDSIAQSLQTAAEEAMGNTGLVFDAGTGLYYDWNVQMYYDHNSQLYYDNDNGIYYTFDQETNSMIFHSQITVPSADTTTIAEPTVIESDGELSDGEVVSEEEIVEAEPQWPPGIRAILLDSPGNILGSLFLVTYRGGCIGRHPGETGKHVIILKDPSISKTHAKLKYDTIQETFQLQDLGSVNGTFINNTRLSESKEKSISSILQHGDVVTFGNSTLLIHIHQGNETCDECEPGQVMAEMAKQNADAMISRTKGDSHKTMLRSLKQKYSLNRAADVKDNEDTQITYHDRAKIRRKVVKESGGEIIKANTNRPNGQTKRPAVVADPKREIADSNIGHQMLSKMGWKSGEGLGKNKTGITNPVMVDQRQKLAGLGSKTMIPQKSNQVSNSSKWDKARERYNDIEMAESEKKS